MRIRRVLMLDLAFFALMILASRAALVIHEVGGHALPAGAAGATKVRVRLSPLGGGYVRYQFPAGREPSPAATATFKLGGITLNLLTGALLWVAARRFRDRGLLSVGLFMFGFGSVTGGLVYLSNGFYYGSGDPLGFVPRSQDLSGVQWMWILFVPAAAAAAWLGTRHYLDLLAGYVPLESARGRLGWTLATAGVASLAYGGLWYGLHDPTVEGNTSEWRLQQEIVKETARRAAEAPAPAPVVAPARDPVPPPPIVVRPEEVKDRVPAPVGPLVLLGATLLSIVVSLLRAKPAGGPARVVTALPALALAVSAAAAVAACRWLG